MSDYWPHLTVLAVLNVLLIVTVIPWVVLTKREATSAVAWCLLVFFLPIPGSLLYWVFGHNYLHRQVRRKRAHNARYRERHPPGSREASRGGAGDEPPADDLGHMALKANAFPVSRGNAVALYHDTQQAFDALLANIDQARHHVHLEFFILHADAAGTTLLDLLAEKARAGVEVRLLLDAVGCVHLRRRALRPLQEAGGKVAAFLPLNRLRSFIHANLRNHRKIVVVDGRAGFTGGMNIGDEYLGHNRYFGYWRDSFLRVEGPAVAGLQRTFTEDWDFTTGEALTGEAYFPKPEPAGDAVVQVAASGPDQLFNCIREIYFMAMLSARRRLWLASPYFVPDSGLFDALRLARYRGVDVRLLSILRPDHYLSFYAGRYFFAELLGMGVQVYQYKKGMMHSKLVLVDDCWAMVGSANLDNRSLRLDFEAGVALFAPALVAELESAYLRDLEESVPLDGHVFASRSLAAKVLENACRLLAPAL